MKKTKPVKGKSGVGRTRADGKTAPEYEVVDQCTVWIARDRKGKPKDVKLGNFNAKITRAVTVDDGAEKRRLFHVRLAGQDWTETIEGMPAEQFEPLDWVIPASAGRARILPGMKPRMRDAVQYLSGDIPEQTNYGHLGWVKSRGEWRYMHAGGAVGADGNSTDVVVQVGDKFSLFQLPDPAAFKVEEKQAAIRASIRLLRVGRRTVTAPLFCAVYRAPIGPADFSLHVVGTTGSGKTTLGALFQQHWGAGLDAQHCPGSWTSTANANEGLRFTAKDTLFLLDDLVPGTVSARDIDRTFRGQGNASGRDRMRADSSIRPTKAPRGLLVSTGEDTPLFQSAAARVLVLPMTADTLDWDRVTAYQRAAARGEYALAMAAYVQWLAGRYDEVLAARPKRVAELRAEYLAEDGHAHKRTPSITAELTFAAETFLAFARDVGAINATRAQKLTAVISKGLRAAAAGQGELHRTADPVVRFGELLASALSSGRAHVTNLVGNRPARHPAALGWRRSDPCGAHVGWVDGGDLYLDKVAAYAVLNALEKETGTGLPSPHELWKRLRDRGVLAGTDGKRGTFTVRKTVSGTRRDVLHVRAAVALGGATEDVTDGEGNDE